MIHVSLILENENKLISPAYRQSSLLKPKAEDLLQRKDDRLQALEFKACLQSLRTDYKIKESQLSAGINGPLSSQQETVIF